MDNNSKYVIDVKSRSQARFLKGIVARIGNFLKNEYCVNLAKRRGAKIGKNVSMPYKLAKKANKNLTVGDNTSIQTDRITMGVPIKIGSNVIIGREVDIMTGSHNIDSADWESKRRPLVIEDYVWLATKVLVLPSCDLISYGAVASAGSVIVKNVQRMQVVGGNPANFLRERKVVHYNLCVEGLLGNDLKTYLEVRNT